MAFLSIFYNFINFMSHLSLLSMHAQVTEVRRRAFVLPCLPVVVVGHGVFHVKTGVFHAYRGYCTFLVVFLITLHDGGRPLCRSEIPGK